MLNGNELLQTLKEKFAKERGDKDFTDRTLADELGLTTSALEKYRSANLTPKQVARLTQRGEVKHDKLADAVIKVIVEFMPLDPVTRLETSI